MLTRDSFKCLAPLPPPPHNYYLYISEVVVVEWKCRLWKNGPLGSTPMYGPASAAPYVSGSRAIGGDRLRPTLYSRRQQSYRKVPIVPSLHPRSALYLFLHTHTSELHHIRRHLSETKYWGKKRHATRSLWLRIGQVASGLIGLSVHQKVFSFFFHEKVFSFSHRLLWGSKGSYRCFNFRLKWEWLYIKQ